MQKLKICKIISSRSEYKAYLVGLDIILPLQQNHIQADHITN